MGVFSGPEISTAGLILNIDAGNRKSWGGVGAERLGGITAVFDNWNGLVGTSTLYKNTPGSQGAYLKITNANGGGVRWWDSVNGIRPCLSSTQYVISAKVKYSGNTPNPNMFYVRQYNSGGTQTSEGGKYSSANQIDLGDGYYLTWALFTTDATAVSFLVQGYDYANIEIWLEDVQCRLAGLADISGKGNNGSLTGSMSILASSGGVVQLSGNNFINTGLNLSTGSYTVISATRYTTTGGRIITALTNNWLMGHWGGSTENHYAEGWVSAVSSGTSDTNWRILAASGNTVSDSWQMYVNGVQTYSNGNGSAGPNGLGINVYATERSSCEVGLLMVFDRVLTPEEIRQVFNAYRGRFGI